VTHHEVTKLFNGFLTIYAVVNKTRCHQTLVHISAKYWPIFIILSLQPSTDNVWYKNYNWRSHHTFNALLHYLVKCECCNLALSVCSAIVLLRYKLKYQRPHIWQAATVKKYDELMMMMKLVSGWGLRQQRSAPPYGSYNSGRILRLRHSNSKFNLSHKLLLFAMLSLFLWAVDRQSSSEWNQQLANLFMNADVVHLLMISTAERCIHNTALSYIEIHLTYSNSS